MANAIIQKSFQILGLKRQEKLLNERVFGNKIGLTASLFGCWHDKISRPFMEGKIAYRACLKCGARKPFDPETLQTSDRFYYPPIIKTIEDK
jgi:hypothetical protein